MEVTEGGTQMKVIEKIQDVNDILERVYGIQSPS